MNSTFDWRNMLRFDKMIAPTFLTILYYIHVSVAILASLWFIMKGMDTNYGGGFMVMSGLAGLVLGPFIIRLFYELLIVIFKIHTRLSNIDQTLRGQPAATYSPNTPTPAPGNPFVQPDEPVPAAFSANYSSSGQTGYASSQQTSGPDAVSQPPIGFKVPTPEPTATTPPSATQAMPDFWATTESLPPYRETVPPATPVPPIELGSILQKIPNWPAALAALIVLYAIFSPYATVGYGSSSSFGQLAGLTYSLKNSSLGVVILLSALVMLGTSAGGLKWMWFAVGYGVTLLGSIVAFVDENSVFSQVSKARATLDTVGSTLGEFMPQANQLSQQMGQNVPSASQFLNVSFYLFIMAMVFLGYWALAGKYEEKGLLHSTTV